MSDVYNLGNVSGFTFTELFNGSADTYSTTYVLNDDISNYKFLIVFSCGNNNITYTSNKRHDIVDVDSMNHINNEYRIYINNNGNGSYSISYAFLDNTSFEIQGIYLDSGWSGAKIYKIIGVN